MLLTPTFETFMRSPLSPLFSGLNRLNALFTVRMARRWHTSPREGVDGPSLGWFKAGSDVAMSPRSLFPLPLRPSVRPSLRPALPARPSRRQLRAAAPPPWPPGSMAAAVETRRVCETAGCSSEAKLQCPTCLKLGIQGSYFCSQVRFPAAQPLARRSGRAAGAGSGSQRRLPAARARPGELGSALCPPAPGQAGAAAPSRGPRTKFPLGSGLLEPGEPGWRPRAGQEPHFSSWPRAMRDLSGTKPQPERS